MKTETYFYGTTIKVGDIMDIDFGVGLTGKAAVVRIGDDDSLFFEGIGELEKASGSYSPNKNDS